MGMKFQTNLNPYRKCVGHGIVEWDASCTIGASGGGAAEPVTQVAQAGPNVPPIAAHGAGASEVVALHLPFLPDAVHQPLQLLVIHVRPLPFRNHGGFQLLGEFHHDGSAAFFFFPSPLPISPRGLTCLLLQGPGWVSERLYALQSRRACPYDQNWLKGATMLILRV